ncbi:unannotated protein [freshwater metagenome]|uniref:Unannotated protein n=1 Tax=freshwater metagenome TaxID=449393 RepID=A0A6J7QJ67_9ZZZZ
MAIVKATVVRVNAQLSRRMNSTHTSTTTNTGMCRLE